MPPARRWAGSQRLPAMLDRLIESPSQYAEPKQRAEALDRLVEVGDKCILKALGSDMYLSQSALSRAIDRLERQGLVERSTCDDDRRSIFVNHPEAGGSGTQRPMPRGTGPSSSSSARPGAA